VLKVVRQKVPKKKKKTQAWVVTTIIETKTKKKLELGLKLL
jgi:hypothetical protein